MGHVKIKVGPKFALVDKEDVHLVKGLPWRIKKGSLGTVYAACTGPKNRALMHRVILGIQGDHTKFVDHINHDGLDNRRKNLRICTQQENQWNKRWKSNGRASSRYKGVTVIGRPFRAHITVGYVPIFLGAYKTEEEAAFAYNKAAKKYFGKFARINHVHKDRII